jgi:hypothetical protein
LDLDDNLELFIPSMALVVMVHVMVAALTFVDIDETHKYHDFSGVQGWVLLVTKLALWAFFAYQHQRTKAKIEERSRPYFQFLFYTSSAYLMAIPLSILSTFMFAPYER